MNDRLLNFLGLCKRAGQLIAGTQTVIDAVKSGKVKLVLSASDLSDHSAGDAAYTAQRYGVVYQKLDRTKEELSAALGKHCGIVGITDEGFANKILTMI